MATRGAPWMPAGLITTASSRTPPHGGVPYMPSTPWDLRRLCAPVLRQQPIQCLPTPFDVFSYLRCGVHHLAVAALSNSQVSRIYHGQLAIALRSPLSYPFEERCCQFAIHKTNSSLHQGALRDRSPATAGGNLATIQRA